MDQGELRVAEALEELPELTRALSDGLVSWSAVRELTRVATADTEVEWMEAARGKTSRELERRVSGRKRGDRPGEPARPEAVRHVLRFEVSAETLAVVREAMVKLRRESGSELDDDATLLLMARHVLGGPVDEGRSSYQMLVTVCERCGQGAVQGSGEAVEVGPEVVELASCDAQRVRAGDQPIRGAETHVGRVGESRSTRHNERNGLGRTLPRAAQDIPPAARRSVMRRDRGCCVVPGCRNVVFVDIHHLEPRSEGGGHDPNAMLVLCAAHHRAVHRGQLVIQARVSTGLSFRHADGRRYGERVCAEAAGAWAKVFRALRSMGFAETETRGALEKVRSETGDAGEAVRSEQLLRRALGALTDAREQRRPTQGAEPRTNPLPVPSAASISVRKPTWVHTGPDNRAASRSRHPPLGGRSRGHSTNAR